MKGNLKIFSVQCTLLTLIDWNWLPLKMILCILHFFWSFNYLAADCARARLKRQKWKICFCTSLMVRACSVQLKSLNPPHPSAVRSPRTAVNLFCSKMKLKVGVACVSEAGRWKWKWETARSRANSSQRTREMVRKTCAKFQSLWESCAQIAGCPQYCNLEYII